MSHQFSILPVKLIVPMLQPLKALSPMLVTLFGIVIEVKPVQPEKALFPMLVTELGRVMEVREVIP